VRSQLTSGAFSETPTIKQERSIAVRDERQLSRISQASAGPRGSAAGSSSEPSPLRLRVCLGYLLRSSATRKAVDDSTSSPGGDWQKYGNSADVATAVSP
jgi:hypothetical protein